GRPHDTADRTYGACGNAARARRGPSLREDHSARQTDKCAAECKSAHARVSEAHLHSRVGEPQRLADWVSCGENVTGTLVQSFRGNKGKQESNRLGRAVAVVSLRQHFTGMPKALSRA